MNTAEFVANWNGLQIEANEIATDKGWWKSRNQIIHACHAVSPELGKAAEAQISIAAIGLMHSELSEAVEGIRIHSPADDKIPEFSSPEAELADVIIRIMDLAHRNNYRVAEAVVAKMEMNRHRPYLHGGKIA